MLKRTAVAAALVALVFGSTAYAGNGAGSYKSSSSSINLVMIASSSTTALASTAPSWGDHITFDVSTTADHPYVTLNCYQNGTWVSTMTAGFYADYGPGQVFALSSSAWRGGAADCNANLHYSTANGKKITLATLDFHVNA